VPYALAELSARRPLPFVRNTIALRRAFQTHQVDLVHCADIDAALQVAPAGRLAGVPVLCHIRNPWTSMLRREALVLSAVDTFVFVSQDTWSTFAYRVGPERGRVLYDGLDVQAPPEQAARAEVRRELGIADGVPVIGMTARVSTQKDYITLARAAKRVLDVAPDARFVIVGDHERHAAHREHFAVVQRELDRLGVAHAFVFTGFRTDVARVMGAFDVFVLSTHFEGLPLVILEAMAMQLPVVATAVNGIPELITSDSVGLLAPHEDDVVLAEHLLALLRDPARARRIAASGRALVERQFSARAFGESIGTLYADALRGRGRAAER
jgi:glycosyltransferase involved in cell wall biosynthesis